jgi:Spy/CpxP family protein refolding chaperone
LNNHNLGGFEMKKYSSLIVALALVTMIGTVAYARSGWGGGYGMGSGYGYNQATPEQQEAFAKFQNGTLQDRKDLAAKSIELRTLYSQPNPDQAKVMALQNDINDLRTQISKKAIEAGVGPGSGRGFGRGYGMGHGYGRGGSYGPGGGYCWR